MIRAKRQPQKQPSYKRLSPAQLAFRRARPFLIFLVLACVFLALVKATDTEKFKTNSAALAAKAGFSLEKIDIRGAAHTTDEAIKLALNAPLHTPIFDLNLPDLRARVTALPWVKDASMQRVLPNMLRVNIVERTPVALFKKPDANLTLIDETGAVLADQNLKTYGRFLLVEGLGADKAAGKLVATLANYPSLAVQIKKAIRISERRWDLVLDATRIKLPEDAELEKALTHMVQQQLLKPEKPAKTIDLRLLDKPKLVF